MTNVLFHGSGEVGNHFVKVRGMVEEVVGEDCSIFDCECRTLASQRDQDPRGITDENLCCLSHYLRQRLYRFPLAFALRLPAARYLTW